MLESPSLLISLDTETVQTPEGLAGTRPGEEFRRILIRAPESPETMLGCARAGREERPFWLPWPAAQTLAVHEHLDEPLLLTARRAWPFSVWVVRDADGRPIGSLAGSRLRDRPGRSLLARPLPGEQGWTFHDKRERVSARLSLLDEGLHLEFGPLLAQEPFVKMLLLVFALTRREVPAATAPGRA